MRDDIGYLPLFKWSICVWQIFCVGVLNGFTQWVQKLLSRTCFICHCVTNWTKKLQFTQWDGLHRHLTRMFMVVRETKGAERAELKMPLNETLIENCTDELQRLVKDMFIPKCYSPSFRPIQNVCRTRRDVFPTARTFTQRAYNPEKPIYQLHCNVTTEALNMFVFLGGWAETSLHSSQRSQLMTTYLPTNSKELICI